MCVCKLAVFHHSCSVWALASFQYSIVIALRIMDRVVRRRVDVSGRPAWHMQLICEDGLVPTSVILSNGATVPCIDGDPLIVPPPPLGPSAASTEGLTRGAEASSARPPLCSGDVGDVEEFFDCEYQIGERRRERSRSPPALHQAPLQPLPFRWRHGVGSELAMLSTILDYIVHHPHDWTPIGHFGFCGESCGCCRAHNSEDWLTGCIACAEAWELSCVCKGWSRCLKLLASSYATPRPCSAGVAAGSSGEVSRDRVSHYCDEHMTRYYRRLPAPYEKQMFLAAAGDGCLECVEHFMGEEGDDPKEEFGEEKYSAYGMALWCIEEGPESRRAGAHLCIESMDEYCSNRLRWYSRS